MSAHTPGPWRVAEPDEEYPDKVNIVAEGYFIALVDKGHGDSEANGRLIAAAPDLLRAASLALSKLDTSDIYSDPVLAEVLNDLEDAVNKARGKE